MAKSKKFIVSGIVFIVVLVGCFLFFGKRAPVQQELSIGFNKTGDVCEYQKNYFNADKLSSKYLVNGVIINPTPDFKGMISFGPYTPVKVGNHTVSVDYKLTNNYRAFVDVAYNQGKVVLQKVELPHDTNNFQFDFKLNKNVKDVEVRFYCEPMEKIDRKNKFQLFGIHID